MGLDKHFNHIAKTCARKVITAINVSCCGFAGGKGFTHPELNNSALSELKRQIPISCHRGYSNGISCEIGLSSNTGIYYRSIAYLVNECAY